MARDTATDDESNEDHLQTLIEEVESADLLSETPFGDAVDRAAQAGDHWDTVYAGITADGDVEYIDKLAEGDLDPERRNGYAAIVSIPVTQGIGVVRQDKMKTQITTDLRRAKEGW